MTPVKPRDAASVVLIRREAERLSVLMGRRSRRAAFAPDVFVFPGGRAEPEDERLRPIRPLPLAEIDRMSRAGAANVRMAKRLVSAAIRETWEETGYALGQTAIEGGSLRPDHAALRFVARAITPRESPIRFHARFFVADGDGLNGPPGGSGELSDLAWYPLDAARKLPAFDVTEFVLGELERFAAAPHRLPVFTYRNGKPSVRWFSAE